MSLTPPKPVPCKGCGKPIVFEKDATGKWLQPSEFDVDTQEKGDKHNCPNYKPKAKEGGWAGTNKQGQMFEARVHRELDRAEATNGEILDKKLDELIGLCREILITVKNKPTPPPTEGEPETTRHDGTDYGF